MRTTSLEKALAFIDYAMDTEGMIFDISGPAGPGKQYTVRPTRTYDPVCIAAVLRNFREEWHALTR